ncbi:MAG: ABC transporter substrate-binding protein [Deltaproteobacteria bacterium]|nr:ABC transporter substrate-binding protein [Deltaproteobacteria bacterium]
MNPLLLTLSLLASPGPAGTVAPFDASSRKPQLLLPDGAAAPREPKRIVSLAPVVTETLFLLGRGENVVGVTRYCDTPAAAQALPKVGGYVDVSLERVLALRPDLVIAMPSLGQRELLERLRGAGIPVLAGFGDSLREVHELVRALGDVTGSAARASTMLDELDGALARFAKARPGTGAGRVLAVVGVEPVVVAGPGTFIAEILTAGGAASAVEPGAPQWPTWPLERLSRRHVDLILVAAGPDTERALTRVLESSLPAAQRPRVVGAPTPLLMRPGPSIARDLETLTRLLAPPGGPP